MNIITDGTTSPEACRAVELWRAIPVVALAVAVLPYLAVEVYDLDIWWHLAIGRDILASRTVPTVDHYALAALGQPYHDSHWLFQIGAALAYRVGGWTGIQVLVLGLWSATLLFCYRATRRWTDSTLASILVFLVAMASVERFVPRPELMTFLGIAAFYHLLQNSRFRSRRDLALFAVIQVVWANSHGLFVIGPFMVGCYWAASAAKRLRDRKQDDFPWLSATLIVTALGTLVTPFGFQGWRYAAVLFMESRGAGREIIQRVGELSPTFGATARSSPAFWFYLTLVCLTASTFPKALTKHRLSARTLIAAALFAASLTGRRNIVLFSLVAAPQVGEWLSLSPRLLRLLANRATAIAATALMLCFAWVALSGWFFLKMEIPARTGFGVTPSFFPHRLPEFLDEIGFREPVLNSNTLGGFYMFHGGPGSLPLTDGRWETYDPATLARVTRESQSPGLWPSLCREFRLRGLLIAHTSAEAAAILPDLRRPSGWRLVYLDRAASFWVRDGDFPSVPSLDPGSSAIVPAPQRPDDGFILNSFLAKLGAVDARILNLRRTLRFGFRRDVVLEQLGPLLIDAGRLREASGALELLLAINPKSEIGLNELAYVSWLQGDRRKAVSLMQRLLAIAPRNESYRENYQRLLGGNAK